MSHTVKVADTYRCHDCGGATFRVRLEAEDANWGGIVHCASCPGQNTELETAGAVYQAELHDHHPKPAPRRTVPAAAQVEGWKVGQVPVLTGGSAAGISRIETGTYGEVFQ